jgi:hypothetical protein
MDGGKIWSRLRFILLPSIFLPAFHVLITHLPVKLDLPQKFGGLKSGSTISRSHWTNQTMNPFLGVFFHWLGGLASGSFYVPYRGVKKWSWETYWLVGGFFSWIICPWWLALLLTENVVGVLQQQSMITLWWTYFFGAMWGFGGLTFGLTMRYLGMSLGMGVALGYCAAFGTLLPPIFNVLIPTIPCAETIVQIAATTPGRITLGGVFVCLVGIAIAAYAGLTKEREMPEAEKKKAIAEFNFTKGILVATFSGIMSACFSFALTAGAPIGEASKAADTTVIWSGLPKLVVVLLGGFTTNFSVVSRMYKVPSRCSGLSMNQPAIPIAITPRPPGLPRRSITTPSHLAQDCTASAN